MTLGREDFSVTTTNRGADVFGLAGFFSDDDLIGHNGSFRRTDSRPASIEHIVNEIIKQAVPDFLNRRIHVTLRSELPSRTRVAGPGCKERKLAKVGVEGSNPFARSNNLNNLAVSEPDEFAA